MLSPIQLTIQLIELLFSSSDVVGSIPKTEKCLSDDLMSLTYRCTYGCHFIPVRRVALPPGPLEALHGPVR